MLILLKYLLFPVSLVYGWVTAIRNFLYNAGVFKSTSYSFPVICVGNIQVGGTGKTPHTEWLINNLPTITNRNIVVLSRGYGRKTKGFIIANESASPTTIGDEPFQIYAKFKSKVKVIVCEKRVTALNWIKENITNPIVIMDDGFQHREVLPGFVLILTPFNTPFFKDYMLPFGRLRESASQASRADAIIFTKIPDENQSIQLATVYAEIPKFLQRKSLYMSGFEYNVAINTHNKLLKMGSQVVAISGIALPKPFYKAISKDYNIIATRQYPDHHNFTEADLKGLELDDVVCTEKDFAKLLALYTELGYDTNNLYYLPIEVKFIDQSPLHQINAFIRSYSEVV
jgi:tetraacyldisaccharide 4'-kinase